MCRPARRVCNCGYRAYVCGQMPGSLKAVTENDPTVTMNKQVKSIHSQASRVGATNTKKNMLGAQMRLYVQNSMGLHPPGPVTQNEFHVLKHHALRHARSAGGRTNGAPQPCSCCRAASTCCRHVSPKPSAPAQEGVCPLQLRLATLLLHEQS